MPTFFYKAINEVGDPIEGIIETDTLEKATNTLVDRGYIPSKIKERGQTALRLKWSNLAERLTPVSAPDLILFTKQFRTMIRAGIPMLNLLQILGNQTQNQRLKRTAGVMNMDIREGSTLYDAFNKHSKIFSPLYCNMIRAGETSGALTDVMERLIHNLEHEHKIKSDIKSALQYPFTVLVFLFVAFIVLLTFVIPRFATLYINAGLELPLPTRISMLFFQLLSEYWYMAIAIAIAVILALGYYFRTKQGKYILGFLLLRIPLIGSLFLKAVMARFASIFAILHESGIPMLDSITILSTTIGNAAVSREFSRIRSMVEEGRGVSEPLRSARYFTPMVTNMVAIGEGSGKLDEMLREVSAHYDDELNYAISRLSETITPVLIIFIASLVGFFALAVFLPMWDLTKMVR